MGPIIRAAILVACIEPGRAGAGAALAGPGLARARAGRVGLARGRVGTGRGQGGRTAGRADGRAGSFCAELCANYARLRATRILPIRNEVG